MRYDCDDPAFAGDFVEFSDSWSRGQVRAVWSAYEGFLTLLNSTEAMTDAAAEVAEEKLLSTLRSKIIALHLTCVDAAPITNAGDLISTRVADVDTRLWAWWTGVWPAHLRGLADLGNALKRRLSDTSAIVIETLEAVPASQNHS